MDISFQNVLEANGIGIAITGILIVFAGLILISLYIASIPGFFRRLESRGAKPARRLRGAAPAGTPAGPRPELLAAVAYVIAMEEAFEEAEDHQRITIRRAEGHQVWAVSGRLRNLSTRM